MHRHGIPHNLDTHCRTVACWSCVSSTAHRMRLIYQSKIHSRQLRGPLTRIMDSGEVYPPVVDTPSESTPYGRCNTNDDLEKLKYHATPGPFAFWAPARKESAVHEQPFLRTEDRIAHTALGPVSLGGLVTVR